MTSKQVIDQIIADIDAGKRVMPPIEQRKRAAQLMLEQRRRDQAEWLSKQEKPETKESDRGYGDRPYHGD